MHIRDEPEHEVQRAYLSLRHDIAALRCRLALVRCSRLLASKGGFNPDQPRDENGRWAEVGNDEALSNLVACTDPGSLLPDVAYPGDYRDEVRDHMVKVFRAAGHTVVTEVLPADPL